VQELVGETQCQCGWRGCMKGMEGVVSVRNKKVDVEESVASCDRG